MMLNPLRLSPTIKSLSVILFIYFSLPLASAQVYNSSASIGAGGTGRAAVEAGDSIYLNSATLVHLRGRHLLFSGAKDEFDVNFSDNTEESAMPGAIAYLQRKSSIKMNGVSYDVRSQEYAAALSQFAAKNFSVGLLAHFLNSRIQTPTESEYNQLQFDLGFSYILKENLGLGAVFYNIKSADSTVPEAIRTMPSLGLGYNYIYKSFVRYRLDFLTGPQFNFYKSSFMAGVESFTNQFIVWRLGYQNDNNLLRNLWTIGAGFNGPKFAFNYAYYINSQDSSDYRHSIDLQIPF